MGELRENPEAWLLSAYAADSHRAWADWLIDSQTQYAWRRFELPGRHFRWRIRGNPLSWLDALPAQPPALIVATSMVDLATLKGLWPELSAVPTVYYFHENQFAYPASGRQFPSIDPQMVQLYGALASTRAVFNSAYNRDTFLHGVAELLRRLPDAVPANLVKRLADKSSVCPVPVHPVEASQSRDPRLILWNHRWEYDKAPELFADALLQLAGKGVGFRVALLGKRPDRVPALQRLRDGLGERIVADGRLERAAYERLIGSAAMAVSTANHEFQGLSMLEAASAGVRPLVPDHLCFVEQYQQPYRYPAGDREGLVARLQSWLLGGLPPPVDVSRWYPPAVAPDWQRLLALGQANERTNRLNNSRPMPM